MHELQQRPIMSKAPAATILVSQSMSQHAYLCFGGHDSLVLQVCRLEPDWIATYGPIMMKIVMERLLLYIGVRSKECPEEILCSCCTP